MAQANIEYRVTADDRTRSELAKIQRRFVSLGKVAGVALAGVGTVAAAGLLRLGRNAAVAADNVGKLSTQLGISEKSLSELKFVAEQTGVEFNQLAISLQRQGRRVSEAAKGTGEAKDAIKELGLSAQDLNRLAPDEQFERIGAAILKVKNPTDQTRLAFKLWDSEGVRNLRTVKALGTEGFGPLKDRAAELGAVMDRQLTDKAAAVQDGFNEIKTAASGVGLSLVDTFGPAIAQSARDLADLIANLRKVAVLFNFLDARNAVERFGQLRQEIQSTEAALERAGRTASGGGVFAQAAANDIPVLIGELFLLREEYKQLEGAVKLVEDANGRLKVSLEGANELVRPNGGAAANDPSATGATGLQPGALADAQTAEFERVREAAAAHYNQLFAIQDEWANRTLALEFATGKQKAAMAIGTLTKITAGASQQSKALFNINKVAAIAEALINAKASIVGAYRYGASIGGPPLGAAFAGIAAATTASQIASIKSTNFGGGTTPSFAGSTGEINGTPITSANDGVISESTAPQSNIINIDFSGGITDTNAVREFIQNDFAEALRDGAGLNVQVVAV